MKKGKKGATLITNMPVDDAVSDQFLQHLSPIWKYNVLIIKRLANGGDSDRCFATFYFLNRWRLLSI
ncbi:MAG: hypothetical protein PUD51_00240 [Prevotellaceae bacterium]|nr:hypothetical protein [Prevotellaceae bacterium]